MPKIAPGQPLYTDEQNIKYWTTTQSCWRADPNILQARREGAAPCLYQWRKDRAGK